MSKKIIGFWGYPDPEVFAKIKEEYQDREFVDLDVGLDYPSSGILPEAYCKIIKNILDNAMYLKDNLEFIVAAVGEEKCDAARIAAHMLRKNGIKILETRYNNYAPLDYNKIITPICTSNLPLKKKLITIMDSILSPTEEKYKTTAPTLGFWGVPPHDIDILKLFPDTTHVYGWVRCVEAGRPADLDLEMHVDEDVPTVFFAQTFCPKMQLAKYLAEKHNGLYVDFDDIASNSVKAKIEAFIKLR